MSNDIKMREYYIVERSENCSELFMDYVAGPMGIDRAKDYLSNNKPLANAYGYKIVYREFEMKFLDN